jgi:hypothetical protein
MRVVRVLPLSVLLLLLVASCEEGGRCAAALELEMDDELAVAALSESQAVTLCGAIEAARSDTFSKEDFCLWKAVNAKAMTGSEEACESDYASCMGQYVEQEKLDCSGAAASAAAQQCQLTVGQVRACLDDSLEERCSSYASISCSDNVTTEDVDEVSAPASCKGVSDQCPLAVLGSGFYCGN